MKAPTIGLVDPAYEKIAKDVSLLKILRALFGGFLTTEELANKTCLSLSQVKKKTKEGEANGYIDIYCGLGSEKQLPGRPTIRSKTKAEGRPSNFYSLTVKGRTILRDDTEIRDQWSKQRGQEEFFKEEFGIFNDLEMAIWKHPQLKNYISNYATDPFNYSLESVIFRPFILGNKFGNREVKLYDELLAVFKKSVPSEFIVSYFTALEKWRLEIDEMVNCYNLLMAKMASLPEVEMYLAKEAKSK